MEALLIASFVIPMSGMLLIGLWLQRVVVEDLLRKTTTATAVFLDDVVASDLREFDRHGTLTSQKIAELDQKWSDLIGRTDVVGLKIWNADERIVYSGDSSLIGVVHKGPPQLEDAWQGTVAWRITDLRGTQHRSLRNHWTRLLEIFAPVHARPSGDIVAVAEFYQPFDDLDVTLTATRRKTWLLVLAIALPMYGLLAVSVRSASNTIVRQKRELDKRVKELISVLETNEQLHDRVRLAAAQATALDESYHQRIGSELHDGPAQDLALALLKIDRLDAVCEGCGCGAPNPVACQRNIIEVRQTVRSALGEVRRLSAGLAGVAVECLSLEEIVRKVVLRHRRRTGTDVTLDLAEIPRTASVVAKITLYRFVQEALHNAFHHSGGQGQSVRVWHDGSNLCGEVSDRGAGFNVDVAMSRKGCLGLRGLRDRFTILGGNLIIESTPDIGTRLIGCLPLDHADGEPGE